jgi:malic enzyme
VFSPAAPKSNREEEKRMNKQMTRMEIAAARWKEMMEKDFDLYYTPGINSPSPEMRTATAMEYAARSNQSQTRQDHCSIGVNQLRRRRSF